MNAPILLFVFNRPDHVRRTVEALQRNTLAAESMKAYCIYIPMRHALQNRTKL